MEVRIKKEPIFNEYKLRYVQIINDEEYDLSEGQLLSLILKELREDKNG